MSRFERAATDVGSDPSTAELLDRLESQAGEIARLNERHERMQEALTRERKMREDAAAWVEREHSLLKERNAEAEAKLEAAGAADQLRQELADQRKQTGMLSRQLHQAWAQIKALRGELEDRRRFSFGRRR